MDRLLSFGCPALHLEHRKSLKSALYGFPQGWEGWITCLSSGILAQIGGMHSSIRKTDNTFTARYLLLDVNLVSALLRFHRGAGHGSFLFLQRTHSPGIGISLEYPVYTYSICSLFCWWCSIKGPAFGLHNPILGNRNVQPNYLRDVC